MIYHSFRGVSSNINQHKALSLPPLPQGSSRLGKLKRVSDGSCGKIPLVLSWSEMVLGQLPGFLRFLEDTRDSLPIA